MLHSIEEANIIEVDFANMSMKEQLEVVAGTDVLVGVHGAALTHLLFLSPSATVLEFVVSHPEMINDHFRDLAKWTSRSYVQRRAKTVDKMFEFVALDVEELSSTLDVLLYMQRARIRNAPCGGVRHEHVLPPKDCAQLNAQHRVPSTLQ
eukprot:TRINITY_DN6730_c0_g1_i2.p3 TRINITY_DN6730_c0_g1~~TRINITY_DN6730_c0_g1_i2.p3  ORF type:complete len:150 (-),score=36.26 TRINITY_DN6730_c0_g1_i2:106-555(-)